MKTCFFVIKKRVFFAFFAVFFAFFCTFLCFKIVNTSAKPANVFCVVIDAGHGGRDGGAVGTNTGTTESFLNLKYAKCLESLCNLAGFNVVLTRKNMSGLYSPFAQNKKRSEMEKRKEIITNSGANVVVSIHMNSFSRPSANGVEVFYQEGKDNGKNLAVSVGQSLEKSFKNTSVEVKYGDFYVLACSNIPSILLECGFLSNPQDEKLLLDENYMQKICLSVLGGIENYLKMS